jgi:hypothetical protein
MDESGQEVVDLTAKPGIFASALLGILLLAFAVSVDFPKASGGGFKGDEATYYLLAHSFARDFDFQYERKDLVRVWEEFPAPEGIFLKKGKDIDVRGSSSFPFFRWLKREDSQSDTRLYFSKSYIYPLVAAPFVFLFGTNGFLVLHAVLIALDLLVVYLFVLALTKSNWVALPLAGAFLGVSVVPVYFVWVIPELFNVSLALYAVFFWAYKEVAVDRLVTSHSRILAGPSSDYIAAVLIALATFSKPPHLLLLFPMMALAALRFQWKRAVTMTVICGLVTAALFAANAAMTGEFNYQGGDRKTFYSRTGFPFANTWETFDNIDRVRGREDLLLGDVLVNTHSGTVLRHNLWYFLVGRNAGLLPYFFPGVLALALFVFSKQKRAWQWLALATIVGAVFMHVFVWPFTWNGGGGPIGSRYFMPFYALFLLLIPPTVGVGTAIAAFLIGALFTAQIVLNPFYSSTHTGEHTKTGPLRMLPIELTLINDLPVAQNPDRRMQPLGGSPQVYAFFPDDNAYNPEGEWVWVKGRSKAEIVLRAPVAHADDDKWISKAITRLSVAIRNGGMPNRVTVSTGRESQTLDMTPGELKTISLAVRSGVPFRREVQPTSYLYTMSVKTSAGFVPFLDNPCPQRDKCPPGDSRFLGAMIHVIPEYTDADISTWRKPPGIGPGKDEAGGVLDTP